MKRINAILKYFGLACIFFSLVWNAPVLFALGIFGVLYDSMQFVSSTDRILKCLGFLLPIWGVFIVRTEGYSARGYYGHILFLIGIACAICGSIQQATTSTHRAALGFLKYFGLLCVCFGGLKDFISPVATPGGDLVMDFVSELLLFVHGATSFGFVVLILAAFFRHGLSKLRL